MQLDVWCAHQVMMKAARIASNVFMALRSPFSRRAVADVDTVDTLPCIAPIPPPPIIACEADCELPRERIESPCCSSGGRKSTFKDVRLVCCAGSCRDKHEEFCLGRGGRRDIPLVCVWPEIGERSVRLHMCAASPALSWASLVGCDGWTPVVGLAEQPVVDEEHDLHEVETESTLFTVDGLEMLQTPDEMGGESRWKGDGGRNGEEKSAAVAQLTARAGLCVCCWCTACCGVLIAIGESSVFGGWANECFSSTSRTLSFCEWSTSSELHAVTKVGVLQLKSITSRPPTTASVSRKSGLPNVPSSNVSSSTRLLRSPLRDVGEWHDCSPSTHTDSSLSTERWERLEFSRTSESAQSSKAGAEPAAARSDERSSRHESFRRRTGGPSGKLVAKQSSLCCVRLFEMMSGRQPLRLRSKTPVSSPFTAAELGTKAVRAPGLVFMRTRGMSRGGPPDACLPPAASASICPSMASVSLSVCTLWCGAPENEPHDKHRFWYQLRARATLDANTDESNRVGFLSTSSACGRLALYLLEELVREASRWEDELPVLLFFRRRVLLLLYPTRVPLLWGMLFAFSITTPSAGTVIPLPFPFSLALAFACPPGPAASAAVGGGEWVAVERIEFAVAAQSDWRPRVRRRVCAYTSA